MLFICNKTSKFNEEELISLIRFCNSCLFQILERWIMLDRMEFYCTLGMRALIFLLISLMVGAFLFMNVIPDSYSLFDGVVDLQLIKRILFIGYLIVTLITFIKIWYFDYQRQYVPRWLR